jgi:hypothetical protein
MRSEIGKMLRAPTAGTTWNESEVNEISRIRPSPR